MVKFKRIKAMLLAGVLTVGMCMGSMTAMAEDGPIGDNVMKALSEVDLTKNLTYPDGVNIASDMKFSFQATSIATAPAAWKETDKVYETTGPSLTIKDATIASATAGDTQANTTVEGAVELAAGNSFSHGGVYLYEISEKAYETDNAVTVDSNKYYLTVYVKSDKTVDKVTLRKADGTKTDKLVFNNKYAPGNLTLEVSKMVSGDYASEDDTFSFTLKLNSVPDGVTVPEEGYDVSSDNGATLSGGGKIKVNTEYTFSLKHGQSIKIEGLPAGTDYTVTETETDKYTEYTKVTKGGVVGQESQLNTITNEKVENKAANAPDDNNKAEFRNDRKSSTPVTGIIMNNLPFILLVAVGLASAVAYFAFRRKITR